MGVPSCAISRPDGQDRPALEALAPGTAELGDGEASSHATAECSIDPYWARISSVRLRNEAAAFTFSAGGVLSP
jgi:hypothetical protein